MRPPLVGVLVAALAGGCGAAPPPRAPRVRFEPRFVLVNWLGQGRFYVAKALASDTGLLRVRYADGTEEWAESARIEEERIAGGDHVTVLLRDSLPPWGGEVKRRSGDRVLVEFDAGGTAWVDLDRVEGVGPAPEPLRLPEARRILEGEDRPTPLAQGPPIDPALLVPRATLTAMWMEHPFDALVLERRGDLLHVRWDGDGTVGWISVDVVREVYPPADSAAVAAGARVRARAENGHATDAVVVSKRLHKTRVRWVEDGTETEIAVADVIRVHARAPREEIREGASVRVGWLGEVHDAEVLERRDDLVRIRWEADGGETWVEAADVREVRARGDGRQPAAAAR